VEGTLLYPAKELFLTEKGRTGRSPIGEKRSEGSSKTKKRAKSPMKGCQRTATECSKDKGACLRRVKML